MKSFALVYNSDGSGRVLRGETKEEAWERDGHPTVKTLDEIQKVAVIHELPNEFNLYAIKICCGAHVGDNSISYTGEFIKRWCEFQITLLEKYPHLTGLHKNCHLMEANPYILESAKEVYELFGKASEFKPNPRVYYFVKYSRRYERETLIRDLVKSPKPQR